VNNQCLGWQARNVLNVKVLPSQKYCPLEKARENVAMKTALAWTTAVALAVASTSALAGPGPLGNIDDVPITISNIVRPGIFQDVYSFNVSALFDLQGSVNPLNTSDFNISGLTVTLQDATFAVVGSDSTPDVFGFSGLVAGNYALSVLGFATGTAGGSYGGNFLASTGSGPVPVPEPGTYALMLVGLGAVGFVAARRKSRA
jgi:hypothetical protein